MHQIKTLAEYEQAALRTAPVNATHAHDCLHAAMGLVTEAAELIDPLKKLHAYERPLDKIHMIEELGDVMWYIPLMCRALGVTMEEVATMNIAKLRSRYPDKFNNEDAVNRDLEKERKTLEGWKS